MENVIHRLALDLTAPDVVPRIEVQRDNARTLAVSLTQGGRPYWIAEGVTAVFSGRKADGKPLFNGCTVEKNRVIYHFTDQTTNVPGIVECEILLYSGDQKLLASPRFELAVEDLIHQEGDVPESSAEVTALTQMVAAGTAMIEDLRAALGEMEGLEEILEQAQTAAENAQVSAERAGELAADAGNAANAAGQAQIQAQQERKAAETANGQAQEAQAKATESEKNAAVYKGAAETAADRAEAAAKRVEDAQGNGGVAEETDPTVPAWAKALNKPSYTAEEVGADPVGTASSTVAGHDVSRSAHNDIRVELLALSDRLNAIANSTDEDLDQLSEIVAYIKSNKSLIDAITTSKVSVADIVDNLTTNVSNRALSAAQGVALKNLISQVSASLSAYQPKGNYALASDVPTKVSQLQNDSGFLTEAHKPELVAAVIEQLPKYAGEVADA